MTFFSIDMIPSLKALSLKYFMIKCQCVEIQESYNARYKQTCEGEHCKKVLCSYCCSKEGISQQGLKMWCSECEGKDFGEEYEDSAKPNDIIYE